MRYQLPWNPKCKGWGILVMQFAWVVYARITRNVSTRCVVSWILVTLHLGLDYEGGIVEESIRRGVFLNIDCLKCLEGRR